MRRRPSNELMLLFDLIEGIVAGAKRYPVFASAIDEALVAFMVFGLIM